MTKVRSNELVSAVQAVQRHAVDQLGHTPHLAIVRFFDGGNADRYRPTASYSAQIRNHAAQIGVDSSEVVLHPGSLESPADVIKRLQQEKHVTGIMPLYPLAEKDREGDVKAAMKAQLAERPELDVDDLLGRNHRAPTPSAMFAMANVMMHDPRDGEEPYFEGRRLEELRTLHLPHGVTAANIVIGGLGELTMGPGRTMLEDQGIYVDESQIITHRSVRRWDSLPDRAVILTATPVAEQIRNENVEPGTVIADAGFGIIDGNMYGNADRYVEYRPDVLWTPPREGIGPVSTSYLHQELLYAAGLSPRDIQPLGSVMMGEAVEYAGR